MAQSLFRLFLSAGIAFLTGKLVSKVKLPAILGWLIAGMALGPHALSLMDQPLLDAGWYQNAVHILECAVGLMIGTELVWSKLKRFGRSIVITTPSPSRWARFCWSPWYSGLFFISPRSPSTWPFYSAGSPWLPPPPRRCPSSGSSRPADR